MRKTLLSLAIAGALSAPVAVSAQSAPAAAPASPHTFTGNVGLFSSYRFRGIDQTFGKPAIQGGFDYSHASGFYAGNWNSNVSEGAGFPGGNIEMDFYGGWKKTWGDWGLDLGAIYYYYPNTDSAAGRAGAPTNNRTGVTHVGRVDNAELYIGGTWKWFTLKYFHAVQDYFSIPDTSGSGYLDFGATYDLGNGWGINGHIGHLKLKNINRGNYTDYKIGLTKDISGWVIGASLIGTNAAGSCAAAEFYCFVDNQNIAGKTKDAGRTTAVLSLSKSF